MDVADRARLIAASSASLLPPALRLDLPFAPLPPLTRAQRAEIARQAQRVNDRYLLEFIEEYGFCPFAKRGRRLGQIRRYVHFTHSDSVAELMTLMRTIAADPKQVVVQVVMPLIEIEGHDWHRFVSQITERANLGLDRDDQMGSAALHPNLDYNDATPFSMIPLFRRAPDPTIQWVRLDAVRELYKGRGSGTRVVSIEDIDALLERPQMTPLYDRVAITNERMARRMRLDTIEQLLAEYAEDGRRSYEDVLMNAAFDTDELGGPAVEGSP